MRRALILGGALVAFGVPIGCSPSSESAGTGVGGADVSQGGGAGSSGGSTALGGSSNGGVAGTPPIIGSGTAGTGGNGDITACAGTITKGELVPVDMLVMLDISASMLEMTGTGGDKWTAVKSALSAFLSDSGSAGLGVGIQYFPLEKPNVPDACTSDAQCGDAGPCFLKICWAAYQAGQGVSCQTEADCEGGLGPCTAFGQCSGDRSYICQPQGGACISATQNLGTCVAPESICLNTAECSVGAYATPAVPIATLPGAAAALTASIDAQTPDGATPTGPALSGAIQQARTYAEEHPDHAVVVVLATDGLPTRCEPLEIADISALAATAVAGTPSVRTFVVGVFAPDEPEAQANLDSIARGGGTDAAFIVDTSQDVTAQFLAALNEIRGTELRCEFQIPAPVAGQTLDFGLVNVDFSEGANRTRLYKVADAASCGPDGGWYYDVPAAPTRIILCPTSCATAKAATAASVDIQLGCKTEVR